jgi:citrate lyase subunit beta / citryl-CoA lyase
VAVLKGARTVLLFVPGDREDYMRKAASSPADTLILDLEDAVLPAAKEAGRRLVAETCASPFSGKEVAVRINPLDTPWGRADLAAAARLAGVQTSVIPKAEPAAVREVSRLLTGSGKEIICLLETALGLQLAHTIAAAAPCINGIMLGAEDLAAEMNLTRTREGAEIEFARRIVSLAAYAAGVQPIDTPFLDLRDLQGLKDDTARAKTCGFTAKACITPRHAALIKEIFRPTPAEVEQARRIVQAAAEAELENRGVAAAGGRMVDRPVVRRARRILEQAQEGESDAG